MEANMDKLIKYPTKLGPINEKVEIKTKKPLGLTAKIYIHEIARKIPLYNQKIDCDAKGKDKNKKEIIVNTLGRWLFGVPDYEGHVRITSLGNTIMLFYPKKSPEDVRNFINSLKRTIEEAI